MFSALAIRVNLDNESLQDKKMFDIMMLVLQFLAPAVMALNKLRVLRNGNIRERLEEAAAEAAQEHGGALVGDLVELGLGAKNLKESLGDNDDDDDDDDDAGGGGAIEMSSIHVPFGQDKRTRKFSSGNPLHIGADGLLTVKKGGGRQMVLGDEGGRVTRDEHLLHITKGSFSHLGKGKGGSVGKSRGKPRGKAPNRMSLIPPARSAKRAEDNAKPPVVVEKKPPVVMEDSDSDEAPPPPPEPKCPWVEYWDETSHNFYYLHNDGTSQWEVPEGYWRNDP